MHTTDQQGSLGEACPASRPVTWPEKPVPENPQASYYRARYYDPNVGRFVSEDPIRFNAKVFNFYAYVSNNPARFGDPLGTCQFDSVTNYHLKCQKMPTPKDICGCHCVYADQTCFDECMACWKKDATHHEMCLCQCKIIKKFMPDRLNKTCEIFCKGIQN